MWAKIQRDALIRMIRNKNLDQINLRDLVQTERLSWLFFAESRELLQGK